MAVAPCLNIKYQYKWRVVVHWLWRMLHYWLFIWGVFLTYRLWKNNMKLPNLTTRWSPRTINNAAEAAAQLFFFFFWLNLSAISDWQVPPSSAVSPVDIKVSLTCRLFMQMFHFRSTNVCLRSDIYFSADFLNKKTCVLVFYSVSALLLLSWGQMMTNVALHACRSGVILGPRCAPVAQTINGHDGCTGLRRQQWVSFKHFKYSRALRSDHKLYSSVSRVTFHQAKDAGWLMFKFNLLQIYSK